MIKIHPRELTVQCNIFKNILAFIFMNNDIGRHPSRYWMRNLVIFVPNSCEPINICNYMYSLHRMRLKSEKLLEIYHLINMQTNSPNSKLYKPTKIHGSLHCNAILKLFEKN
ncbi:hypothetical protein RF11_00692 [Thelohanellus kitauei]|uniref:Uncharacterized protein n=1 Tax=Thelohanellus kitauei TaxID=669202 RepID=A0A0C2JA08_THEKT|nr:hypothetical protein RF11_00692 [Thelohanellus kitauei]